MSDDKKVCPECGAEMYGIAMEIFEGRKLFRCAPCDERKRAERRARFMEGPARDVVSRFGPLHGIRRIELDQRLVDFAQGVERGAGGLFIQGVCGSGKTQALTEIAHLANEADAPRQFEDMRDQFASCFKLHNCINIRVCEEWDPGTATMGLLLIDDVDLLNHARFEAELLRLVDLRYKQGAPTVFTSTAPLGSAFISDAIRSRVAAMCGASFVLPAVNHRAAAR